jgi:hypothetical protein
MRGLASILFGRELAPEEVSTVLVVCSADEQRFPPILAAVQQRFSKAHLTYIVPREWTRFLPPDADRHLVSDIKRSPLRVLERIRSRRYDVTVLMLTGLPVFRKAKLWALFTNYRVLVIYSENIDFFSCGAANRRAIIRHLKWRLTEKGVPSLAAGLLTILLSPLGLLYLLFFTGRVLLRSRLRLRGVDVREQEGPETN